MKKALAILMLMSLGLGGCYWGPGGDYGERGHAEHGERGGHFEHGR